MASEKTSRGQAWFCTSGLPSDITVEVDNMIFHLHKYPLISKSRRLNQLIEEQEESTSQHRRQSELHNEEADDCDEIEEVHCHITLHDFPGGMETFELAAKFCYGVKIEVSAHNAAPLRCAGEYLEMTEEYSNDNLIAKTEKFFTQTVLKNLRDAAKALKSCEHVIELAEYLEIPQRCVEAIVAKASLADPSMFGWPMNDGARRGRRSMNRLLRSGIEGGSRRKGKRRGSSFESWLEDLSLLNLSLFRRLISAMKDGDLGPEIVEGCLMHYAKKYIPGASRSSRRPAPEMSSSSTSSSVLSESEQRELLEMITSSLPERISCRSSSAVQILFGLLRTASILNVTEDCRSALERRIGEQLEQATLDDLLIPSYSYLNETLYDVDCVERILGHFLEDLEVRDEGRIDVSEGSPALLLVGKLIDGYLSEIASDANLKPERFYQLAIALPEQARLFDDGLYRAVDVYLKAHPWTSEADREKVCGVMGCQKLTLEACTHAAQNERLPLRAVVQVLFFEQLQLRHAIAGTLLTAEGAVPLEQGRLSASRAGEYEDGVEETGNEEEEREIPAAAQGSVRPTWRAAARENQVLRLDMDSMRTRVHQLERECSTMKKVIEKMDKVGGGSPISEGGRKSSLSRRFGCKFKTQVCDSHEATVVEARRGRYTPGPSRT
ncbi:hypothetical protein SAY87_000911 [Trapa incisa]|uniref:Phototropic-responsive NPH3 family protein n=1 Tax=Trapa incisa TaxID=236973 RepID=A0AAN7GCE0_9MYRT|nr:hypothetical protein SAY87_000911 [Trapa incisa]